MRAPDFRKFRSAIALWTSLAFAGVTLLRLWLLAEDLHQQNVVADFVAVLVYTWLLWQINFWFADRRSKYLRFHPGANRKTLLSVSTVAVFFAGTFLAIGVEYLCHVLFHEPDSPVWDYFFRGFDSNLIITVTYYLLQLMHRKEEIEVENANLRGENTRAQLDLLRQQVNPHFLFNALNTLKSMVKNGEPQAKNFILHLSDFYRYLLQGNIKSAVPLRDEVEMLQSYSFLLKTRFSENFDLKIDLPDRVLTSLVPPLALQLLVENAVKHNVVSTEKPLRIEIRRSADGTALEISNTLSPKLSTEPGTGTGLTNIANRYQLLAGKEIQVEKTETAFLVRLPIIPNVLNEAAGERPSPTPQFVENQAQTPFTLPAAIGKLSTSNPL